LEAFIQGRFFGLGDRRGPRSDGGSYKSSIRFSIDPGTGAVSGAFTDVGKTAGLKGAGSLTVGDAVSDGQGGWNIPVSGSVVNGARVGPRIDFSLTINVTEGGAVSVSGKHDGFPSYELWSYSANGASLDYFYDQERYRNAFRLFGSGDVKFR